MDIFFSKGKILSIKWLDLRYLHATFVTLFRTAILQNISEWRLPKLVLNASEWHEILSFPCFISYFEHFLTAGTVLNIIIGWSAIFLLQYFYRKNMTQDVSRYFINHLNNLKKLANLVYICRHCLDLAFLEENFGRITRNYHKSKTFFFIDLITENKISFQNSFEECRRIVKLIREWLRECKGGVFFFIQ